MPSCEVDFPCVEDKKFKVCFVSLGEGYEGDYDPNDPNDKSLLRIDVTLWDEEENDWKEDMAGSSCTGISVNAPVKHLEAVLRLALKLLNDGDSPENVAGRLSWFNDEDAKRYFEKGTATLIKAPWES